MTASIDLAPLNWDIAREITAQATVGVLMSLGAHNLFAMPENDKRSGGATWDVRVLPMKANGERAARPRIMKLTVELTHADDYTVTVDYWNRGKRVQHFTQDRVYCDQLAKLLLALDWDGDEILNPRYI